MMDNVQGNVLEVYDQEESLDVVPNPTHGHLNSLDVNNMARSIQELFCAQENVPDILLQHGQRSGERPEALLHHEQRPGERSKGQLQHGQRPGPLCQGGSPGVHEQAQRGVFYGRCSQRIQARRRRHPSAGEFTFYLI